LTNEGQKVALVYNSSASSQTIRFISGNTSQSKTISGLAFQSILLS
jgi:hypothetical protein